MTVNAYPLNATVALSTQAATAGGVLTDPGALLLKVKQPGGTATTYTYGVDAGLIRDAVGKYHLNLKLTLPGRWFYRWEATGAVEAASEGELAALPSAF